MTLNKLKQHKVLSFFNLLAIALIVIGSSTSFFTAAGTSISGGIGAWGGLLLMVMIFVDGIVIVKHSFKKSTVAQTTTAIPDAHQRKLSRVIGISIILGSILGLVATVLILAPAGGDAGLVFIPLAALLMPLGAFLLWAIAQISFGTGEEKKKALKWFAIVVIIFAAYFGYGFYQDKYGQKYCDGQPIEQYQGPLPTYCQNQ